jgi:predicted NUDIX family NTP pyrophosphohydrolase
MASRKPQSAGLLLFRKGAADLEVLLGHPGGPFWQKKDDGAWSIPKGLIGADEAPLSAARREFAEETGYDPDGDFWPLGEARQPGGKIVQAWAVEGDWDPALISSNTFEMEWPPRSRRRRSFPEIDRAAWFGTVPANALIAPVHDRMLGYCRLRNFRGSVRKRIRVTYWYRLLQINSESRCNGRAARARERH